MKQIVTTGIMLARTNFGEADRIITILTPDYGKIKVMARGVRKVKSKLAGGVELFSVSNITFIRGRGDMGTLVSTRLQTHFSNIAQDIDRTMTGYDVLKILNKATEDATDVEYYRLLLQTLTMLNATNVDHILTKCWFQARLLNYLGHSPNISTTISGEALSREGRFSFDYQAMGFYRHTQGKLTSDHIKVLRLLQKENPQKLILIKDITSVIKPVELLLTKAVFSYLQ